MDTQYKDIETKSFTSDVKNLAVAELLVDSVFENNTINKDYYGNVLIAVTEAVNNAIQHGNKKDITKEVIISAHISSKDLRICIHDEGNGFDYNNLPDPTAPQNIEKETGRGIFLMKSLSDEVIYENNGSKVVLVFSLL